MWEGVESLHGGRLDIRVTEHVRLQERQAVFTLTVENHSPYPVENVYGPYLGDVRPPSREGAVLRLHLQLRHEPGMADLADLCEPVRLLRRRLSDTVRLSAGGRRPTAPFILLRDAHQGLYVGIHKASAELVSWHTELRPGYGDAMDSQVPDDSTIGGTDVSIRFAAVHVPYILPGERAR